MRISALRERLTTALLEFAWEEWAEMGVFAVSHGQRRWSQDPEALLLLTFEVARADPRLFDEVLDWMARNEALISVRRLRALCDEATDERLANAALEWAKRQHGSRMPHIERVPEDTELEALFPTADLPVFRVDPAFAKFGFARPLAELSGKSLSPDLLAPINFAFRLRQMLGVGARSEAVRYLLTGASEAASVAEVASSSGYSKRNVQEALTSLVAAGVAARVGGHTEQRFAIDRSRWAYLLDVEPHQIPAYRDWPRLLGALRELLRWLMRTELDGLSDYMRASQAADLLDVVRPRLSRAGVLMPARMGGDRSWTDLEDTIEYALFWLSPDAGIGGRPAAFEVVPGLPDGHWWRLTSAAGRVVALSAEPYASRGAARSAIERVRGSLGRFEFRVTLDAGAYRWHVVAENGRVLAASTEAFATRGDAERAARDARDLIAGAAAPTDARVDPVNRSRRHVTLRQDGRWQVQAEGATRAASTHATQAEAVRSAKRQARNTAGGAEVIVHTRDGRIRETDVVV